jgi:hypothetical protein
MKQFLTKAMILTAMVIQFTSCQKDKEESILGSLEITVKASETYAALDTENIEVMLTNTLDNSEVKVNTNSTGVAKFLDLAPGTYTVSASKILSAEAAYVFTGLNKEVTLNATKADIVILPKEAKIEEIVLDGKTGGALIIREIYSTGAANDSYAIMFKDQFVEIYNNSEDVQYVDGLYLAYLAPQRAGSDPTKEVVTTLPIGDNVYASKIIQFPGTGTQYPVEPGTAVRIALNAVNYLEAKPLAYTTDNSTADFDTYGVTWLQSLGRTGNAFFDIDNPNVPTMNCIYLFVANNGFFNFDNSPSLALLKLDANPAVEANIIADPDITTQLYYVKLPTAAIIDGVDVLETASANMYKRLPASVDAGFTYVIDLGKSSYTGKSVRRKISKTLPGGRVVLMDTNNSGNDFEANHVTVR